jgi:S-adenosylmethionine synthetase
MATDIEHAMMMHGPGTGVARAAEMVTDGHPDKFCDQVADAILDEALRQDPSSRVAIECLAKDNLLVVAGEVSGRASIDYQAVARHVWQDVVGYGRGDELAVLTHITPQSEDIAQGGRRADDGGVDFGGAGDQGVMVGYATSETPEMLPEEYVLARSLCQRLKALRQNGEIPWLRADGKSQIAISDGQVVSVVVAAHHDPDISIEQVREALRTKVVDPVVANRLAPGARVVINGTGAFRIGGPRGDAGVVGRKIVVDAYGPRVPVGGGAYSGKDPSKVDRSAAYMARHIAKSVVANGMAEECIVTLAFGISQRQPEMLTVLTPRGCDQEATRWVRAQFGDLRPEAIIEYLDLRRPKGWDYCSAASFGHYGRDGFPWEGMATARMERPARAVRARLSRREPL